MKKQVSTLLVLACAISAKAELSSFNHPTEIIVSYKNPQNIVQSLISNATFEKLNNSTFKLEYNSFVSSKDLVEDLKKDPNVKWAAPNRVYIGDYREFMPSDERIGAQNHHKLIKSFQAWDENPGSEDVVVAVTDDGFKLDHEDIKEAWFYNKNEIPGNSIDDDNNGYVDDYLGYDFNNNDADPSSTYDYGSHGTHVAGIVGAVHDNGIGVSGIAPRIKVMPLKFYGQNGLKSDMIFRAYSYASDNGAKIINTSYNIDSMVDDEVYLRAIEYAKNKDVLVFNSAGNNGRYNPNRGVLDQLILVASSVSNGKKDDTVSGFSNYGDGIDIIAPGDPIYSHTSYGSYGNLQGTSMATPVAAGVAAYIWSTHPEFTASQVAHMLFLSSDNITLNNREKYINAIGAGRVNSFKGITLDNAIAKISAIDYNSKERKLKIYLHGVLDESMEDILFAMTLNSEGKSIVLENNRPYEIGTNYLSFDIKDRRKDFTFTIDGDQLRDVFGNKLDANNDGVAGGQTTYTFNSK